MPVYYVGVFCCHPDSLFSQQSEVPDFECSASTTDFFCSLAKATMQKGKKRQKNPLGKNDNYTTKKEGSLEVDL